MLRRCLLALLLTTFPAAGGLTRGVGGQTSAPAEGSLSAARVREGRDGGAPLTDVYLHVRGRTVRVWRNAAGELSPIARADYDDHKVPAGAVAAGTLWWAGQGKDFYVTLRRNQLYVYARDVDESGGDSPYRRLPRAIPLPRR
jgi:hypothetical protein